MKYVMNSLAGSFQFSRHPNERTKCTFLNLPLLALVAGLVLATGPAQAGNGNLLVNPGFETPPSGHVPYSTPPPATSWTYFSPPEPSNYFGDYWVQQLQRNVPPVSGTYYWNQWNALYANPPTNNVAGIYQTFSSTPGSTYQASGWFSSASLDGGGLGADCVAWIQVEFLGANTNVLALYKSDNFSASVGLDTWFQYQVTNACDLTQPVATGDPYFTTYAVTGSVSQLVAPLGTTAVRYRYALLAVGKEGGSVDLDDAVLNQVSGPIPPVINNNLFPQNMIFVNPSDGITFNVSSPSGFTINNSGIHLVLNGTDVSGSLAISGSSSNKNVTYSGLQSNLTYTVSITVTDAFNLTVSASTYFETTWVGIQPVTYLWEAEDFDFNSGKYINNPDLCSASGNPNCYFGTVGVEGADEHSTAVPPAQFYRGAADGIGTKPSGDYSRPNLFVADRIDYCINPFNGDPLFDSGCEWVNYTRDWPNSTNWVVARLATDIGLSGNLLLSQITPTATNDLGTFTLASGHGWTTYDNIYLKDTNGNNANIVLNGKATLRVTSGGNLLPGCFMLVAAQLDLPIVSGMYPTGKHPFEPTNALSFTVTSPGATFPANSIKLNLDGLDASAGLVITGSASTKNVIYPVQLNAPHTAIITVTNSLGHGIRVTNQFDTFSQDNYMVEAEDFDYGGGQYVSASDWYPDAYLGLGATTNIDFQHSPVAGEQWGAYRSDGIPESPVQNYAVEQRQKFVDLGGLDFQLDWFAIGDWANYTGVYPTGNFYVYIRSAGLFGISYSMYLDQVVSGAGTTNQVTKRLGNWGALGSGQQTYAWVPLTDAGLVAPVVVKLGGTNTLRISTATGNCYPNYFMLVPASGITLSAAGSGSNVSISFPTQAGATYRVFYRANLTTGNWILLATVLGDGTVKSVSDPQTGSQRFYKMTSP